MKNNKKIAGLLLLGGMITGVVASTGYAVHAQTATDTQASVTATNTKIEDNGKIDPVDTLDQSATEAKATVKMATAIATAEASVGAKSIDSHIEDENGVLSYDIFFANKKVEIDATTGVINNTKTFSGTEHNKGNENKNDSNDSNDSADTDTTDTSSTNTAE